MKVCCFMPGWALYCRGHIMQLPHLVPLVAGKGKRIAFRKLILSEDIQPWYLRSYGRMPAWISSACFRTGGSSLPRFFALRRIPKQAVLLK